MRQYQTLTLSLLAATLAMSGCFLFRPQPATTAGPETAESTPPPTEAYAGDEPSAAGEAPPGSRPERVEPARPCMYDAKEGAYRICVNPFQGKCSFFQEKCLPDDKCMYNADEGVYQKCANPFLGKCSHYMEKCVPASGCMYNPKENAYQKCANPFLGKCSHYTTACLP